MSIIGKVMLLSSHKILTAYLRLLMHRLAKNEKDGIP